MKTYKGVNWNSLENSYIEAFWLQNTSQFWLETEIAMNQDINVWRSLDQKVKDAYIKNLVVLTVLDSHQGLDGMVHLLNSFTGDDKREQTRAVLAFVNTMECIHARSYSSIFSTFLSSQETEDYLKWGELNINLQSIMNIIIGGYEKLGKLNAEKHYGFREVSELEFKIRQWKTMVLSCMLESFVFYSGFYYPLWFGGQGKLSSAAEIINLIIRDESVHGLFIGLLSKEIYSEFDKDLQKELYDWAISSALNIYKHLCALAEEIYSEVGLTHDVKVFMRYNCNKALMNLGFDPYFEEEEVNPIVLNGLNTESKTHDLFSLKGNSYQKAVVEELRDDDFDF